MRARRELDLGSFLAWMCLRSHEEEAIFSWWGWGWDSGRWRYSKKASDVMGTQWANIWSLESARKVLGNADKLVGQEECWAEGTNVQDLICSIHSLSWPHINKHVCWWLTQEPHFNPMNVVGLFFFFFMLLLLQKEHLRERSPLTFFKRTTV